MAEWNYDFSGNYSPADIDFLASLSPSDMDNTRISDWITEDANDLFMEDYYDPNLIAALDAFPNGTETARTEQGLETTFDLPGLCSPPQIQPHLWKTHDETMMDDFGINPFVFEPEPVIGNTTIQPQLLSLTNEAQQSPEPPVPHHNMVRIDPTDTALLPESEHSTNGRRPQPRIAIEARDIMLDFYGHTPYPTAEKFEILALQTNLEVRRVRNWFNNHRSRQGRVDDNPASSSLSGEGFDALLSYLQPSQTRLSKESLESVASHCSLHQQPPLEAWISSSLESDPIVVANIEAAVAKAKTASIHSDPLYEDTSSHSEVYKASLAQSSQASSSMDSVSSSGSYISATSRTSRRGRRRAAPYPLSHNHPAAIQGKHDKERPYTCTFYCGKRFKWKYDWARHEEAVHFPRATWVCCANKLPSHGNCPYCPAKSPDRSHIEGHRFDACEARSLEQRTFYRRDNFVEHIHKVHGNGEMHPNAGFGCPKNSGHSCSYLADMWKQQAPPISPHDPVLKCGFCRERLSTWERRRDHISNHFMTEKTDISSWWPERKPINLKVLTSTASTSHWDPGVCRYCHEWFPDGEASHPFCRVWSCRFLNSISSLAKEDQTGVIVFPKYATGRYLETSRGCNQELFTSKDDFCVHLNDFHGALQSELQHGGMPERPHKFQRHEDEFKDHFSQMWIAEFEPARTSFGEARIEFESELARTGSVEGGPEAVLEEQDEENASHYLLLRLPEDVDEFAQLPVSNVERAGPVSSKHKHRLSTLFCKVLQRYRADSSSRRL